MDQAKYYESKKVERLSKIQINVKIMIFESLLRNIEYVFLVPPARIGKFV